MRDEFAEQVREADGQNPHNRFHFLSIGDIYSRTIPTEWLIKDYLDTSTLAQIFGEPGSMKSFMALDMGLCIATKTDWHGHPVQVKGPVSYIAGEGLSGIGKRLKAWEKSHGISLKDVPFFVSDRPAQFLDESSAQEVINAVDNLKELHGTPVLIIIDTLNRNFGPGDENFTSDMTRFVSIVDAQLRIKYGSTILIIHHNGLSNQDRARGNSALRAALDWEYRLTKIEDIRTLASTKTKDHEPPPPISFKPEIIILEVDDLDGKFVTSCVLHQTDAPAGTGKKGQAGTGKKPLSLPQKIAYDTLLAAIKESGEDGKVHEDSWRKIAYSKGISNGEIDAKKHAFRRAITGLREQNLIDVLNDYYWPIIKDKMDFNNA
ncbi:MAG: AAA family ATPase [Deltaproteobacteria bacterium]